MTKYRQILHGSTSECFINGEREELSTKIEIKMTGDWEDGNFCGEYASFPIYNGYNIEGTITSKKHNSALELAIVEGYRTGVMPDITVISSLGRPGSAARERWSITDVVFTEVALANIEAKKAVERELPFKSVYAKNLEAIN